MNPLDVLAATVAAENQYKADIGSIPNGCYTHKRILELKL
jgi:hypothetical protein